VAADHCIRVCVWTHARASCCAPGAAPPCPAATHHCGLAGCCGGLRLVSTLLIRTVYASAAGHGLTGAEEEAAARRYTPYRLERSSRTCVLFPGSCAGLVVVGVAIAWCGVTGVV
jgi:hypothetical protein